MRKYTREVLEPLVAKHESIANILRELGVSPNGGSTSHLSKVVKGLRLDTSHFRYGSKTSGLPKLSDEQLLFLVEKHKSVAGVLRELGCAIDGRCHRILSQMIADRSLDCSHFTGRSWNKGLKMPIGKGNKKDPKEFFVLKKQGSRRTSGSVLKARLLEIGRPEICGYCGLSPVWNGQALVLEVDHRNGCFWDDREDNLVLACPNCHSQQPTCGIKNKYLALSFNGQDGALLKHE